MPKELKGHRRYVAAVAILGPDRIVSGSWDKTVKDIWNTDGQCLKTLEGHSHYVLSVAILGPAESLADLRTNLYNYGKNRFHSFVWKILLSSYKRLSGSWSCS